MSNNVTLVFPGQTKCGAPSPSTMPTGTGTRLPPCMYCTIRARASIYDNNERLGSTHSPISVSAGGREHFATFRADGIICQCTENDASCIQRRLGNLPSIAANMEYCTRLARHAALHGTALHCRLMNGDWAHPPIRRSVGRGKPGQ